MRKWLEKTLGRGPSFGVFASEKTNVSLVTVTSNARIQIKQLICSTVELFQGEAFKKYLVDKMGMRSIGHTMRAELANLFCGKIGLIMENFLKNDFFISGFVEHEAHDQIGALLFVDGSSDSSRFSQHEVESIQYRGYTQSCRVQTEESTASSKREYTAAEKAEANKVVDADIGETILMKACQDGQINEVRALLEAGAYINAEDSSGWTALLYAISEGRAAIVKLLIDSGADINAEGTDGFTALMWASDKGDASTVKLLLEAGANVNACDSDKTTALILASAEGNESVVQLLVEAGANVNLKDGDGWTALFWALNHQNTEVAKFLIKSGALVKVKSDNET